MEKKEIIKTLFEELQADLLKELQESIKKNGIASSIAVCKTISPAKEQELSAKYPGLRLRRISEKNRNPEHAPNEWEAKVIQDWKQFSKTGNPPYMFFESSPQELHALKPILLANETCLKCHGSSEAIDAKTKAALLRLYPNDKATGYKLGDLRGAFSASWKRL
ncbi:PF11845 family protein [Leptospira inadai serovar Lyme str. 10]|uniref:PF11845 family protein n=1 Tax=Leptospira inadai serovar Lyme str. 10 TaxID=1049790 RepID=V6HD61_9LEPT|nr:PF11845 family protein [Leptospira inadai serovar Lyme str. 10]